MAEDAAEQGSGSPLVVALCRSFGSRHTMHAAIKGFWLMTLLLGLTAIGAYLQGSFSAYREREQGAPPEVVEEAREEWNRLGVTLLLAAVAVGACGLLLERRR
jgi:hypothetical protein